MTTKLKIKLIVSTVLSLIVTWIVIFSISHKARNIYGFFSVVKPVNFRTTTETNMLILDIFPNEHGLRLIELDLVRDDKENKGHVFATVSSERDKLILSNERYTTTHVDNSQKLLISLSRERSIDQGNYRLTIKTSPPILVAEYLVKMGLHPIGVYFMDKNSLTNYMSSIPTLIRWKMYDIFQTFSPIYLALISLFISFLPTIFYILYQRVSLMQMTKPIARLVLRIMRFVLVGLGLSLEKKSQTLRNEFAHLTSLYIILFYGYGKKILRFWRSWYKSNNRFFWDSALVSLWVFANITLSAANPAITDRTYSGYLVLYGIFSLLRRVDSRAHYVGALISLVLCPYFVSQDMDLVAEKIAIFVYFFMVFGAATDALTLFIENRRRKELTR